MFDPQKGKPRAIEMEEQIPKRGDYLLEVLELAMNRDPDQDFELLLVLESEREYRNNGTLNK